VAHWFMHCATSRQVAVSIPDGVNGIFHWHNPSGRTMALGYTPQPLTEKNSRNISWGGGGVNADGGQSWQTYHLHVPIVLKSLSIILRKPSWPVQTCTGIALRFLIYIFRIKLSVGFLSSSTKVLDNALYLAAITSFHILPNSPLTVHPIYRRYINLIILSINEVTI
jgi:hypothetical protein